MIARFDQSTYGTDHADEARVPSLLAARISARCGCVVIGVDLDPRGVELARDWGGFERSVLEATGGPRTYLDWTSATPTLVEMLRSTSAVEFG